MVHFVRQGRGRVLAALLPLALAVRANAQEITLRAADNQPENYPTVVGLRAMADYLAENSDGRIQMAVFAGGQLGDERSTIEQAQLGVIDIVRTSTSPVGGFYPPMGVYSLLLYLFRDEAHFVSVLQGEVGEELLAGLSEAGLVGLAYYDSGTRNFFNNLSSGFPSQAKWRDAVFAARTKSCSFSWSLMPALDSTPEATSTA